MPVNAGYEYAEAQKKVNEAKTPQEKIKSLEHLLSVSPSHKGAEKLRQEIKTKISKLKAKVEKERAKKGGGFSLSIKKEGAAQIALVGLTNSGKSTILKKLTGAKVEIADYPFTTKTPEIGVMDHHGVKIQLVEVPAFFEGFIESERGPAFMSIARSADLIVIVLDGRENCEGDLKIINNEFSKAFMVLKKIRQEKTENEIKKCLVVVNKVMNNFRCSYPVCWIDDLKHGIWNMLGLIYVQTKQQGKKADWPPVALKKGSSIRDLANLVHKDFVKNFKYARIWGKSVKHDRSTAGLDHTLEEGDVVEIHTK